MKRFLATALTLSMVLMLMGCSKEETTKKKKKPKKTTTTEESAEDTTEEPTEDSSETEDTSESQDTIPEPTVDASTFAIDHTLELLQIYNIPSLDAYGYYNSTGDYPSMTSVEKQFDDYYFYYEGCPELAAKLDEIFQSYKEQANQLYKTALDSFVKTKEAGINPDWCMVDCETEFYRADTQICSFVLTENFSDISTTFGSLTTHCYNLRSQDGSEIALTDIVVDTDAFCQYVKDVIATFPLDAYAYSAIDPDLLVSQIKDGSANFVLAYDAMYFQCNSSFIKIPVAAAESLQCINYTYFGSTPEWYSLRFDENKSLYWDVNGDGKMDTVTLATNDTSDGDSVNEMTITINGNASTFGSEVFMSDGMPEELAYAYLMQTDDGCYIVTSIEGLDMFMSNGIFKVDGEIASFSSFFHGHYSDFPFDPSSFEMVEYYDIVGTHAYEATCSLLSGNGEAYRVSDMLITYGTLAETAKDITAMKVDYDRSELGEATIPAGTPIRVIAYDDKFSTVLVVTLPADGSEGDLFELPFEKGTWPPKLCGEDENKILNGVIYAG